MNYYNEIKDTLLKNEIYKKAKDYSKNKSDLNSYYEVGRLLIEAQGGEERAGYGNKLIKEYSKKLTEELGKGYTYTDLSRMRQFYLLCKKLAAVPQQLTWSHYKELLPINDIDEIKYYIYISEKQNISYRELREKIKSKEYERIGYKEELSEPKVNTLIKNPITIKYRELRERIKNKEYERIGYKEELSEPKVNTLIKNPITIKSKNIPEKVTEYALHTLILENIESFLKELGMGFTFVGHEVKIKIGKDKHSIDFLLFNYRFNCFVVVEVKVTSFKAEYIGQVLKYINYVDENIKEISNNKTVGIVICKDINGYVLKYCTDDRIFTTTYEFVNSG